jgi:hypothetical protein
MSEAAAQCPECPSDTADVEFTTDEDGFTHTWLTCVVCLTLWELT